MVQYAVILAGGVGSRFWPISTREHPKQFLDILGTGKSLIQLTYERLSPIIDPANILVVTNEDYVPLVRSHLPDLPQTNILGEPTGRNTAPAIAWAAEIIRSRSENAVFAVLPSDQVVLKPEEYRRIMSHALEVVSQEDVILTIGIQPTRPDTGYGYINFVENDAPDAQYNEVNEFKEKPDLATAQSYLSKGTYLWNAGMFVWSLKTLNKAFKAYCPEVVDPFESLSEEQTGNFEAFYSGLPSISIDYAILEKAKNVGTIPADIGWSDLGTWNSLHTYLDKDDAGNATVGENIHAIEAKDSIVYNKDAKTVVVKGLEGYIVVQTDEALLIYPKNEEQEIKTVVKGLGLI